MNRREFIGAAMAAALAGTAGVARPKPERKMKLQLGWGSIGVRATQTEAMALAQRFGFEAVEVSTEFIAGLSDEDLKKVLEDLNEKKLVWGTAGLGVDFRGDEAKFLKGMQGLPRHASALKKAGVTRMGTWVMPCHESFTYLQNFKLHATRLREIGKVLKDNGLRLGLEYVGTQTMRDSKKFPFLHTMAECKELIAEIGTGNIGFVLDTWHWWTAGDTVEDLLSLTNDQIVSVDVNDAPAGIPKDQQIDTKRELPASTGVIDIATFLNALMQVGYDGPVRAEPFNKPLNDLENDAACAAVIESLKKAFALAEAKA
jgi:sugar phosphate isomerase/epimerase